MTALDRSPIEDATDRPEGRCTLFVDSAFIEKAAHLFTVLADPVHTKIVIALRDGDYSVNLLADVLDLTVIEIRAHLSALEEAGLVTDVPHNGRPFFGLAHPHVAALVNQAVLQAQASSDSVPPHRVRLSPALP